jgi:hypothetical protein
MDYVLPVLGFLATGGVLAALVSWYISSRKETRERRRTIRDELTKFHQLIFDTDRGAWPPGTPEGWQPLQRQVLERKERARQLLDADRATVGRRWSILVEECLESGWQLLHNCYGQSTLRGPRVMTLSDEMPARRAAYYEAYKRVTGATIPKHVR